MAKKKKRYTEEFKREAVRLLVTRGSQSVAEIAKSLGVQSSQLYEWRRRFADVEVTAQSGRGESKDEELERLRRENVQLRKEKETLKKSVALFIRENER
jgi:transposase